MRFKMPVERIAVSVAVLGLVVAGVGCGKNRVTVDVDVASFIDPTDLTGGYNAPPFTPAVELDLEPVAVNLVEGFEDFGTAEEVAIDVTLQYDNYSGVGDATFTLYFHHDKDTVYTTSPVTQVSAQLKADSTSVSSANFLADERVLGLFTQKQMFMGVRFAWQPQTTDGLDGMYTITALRARVVSNVEVF